MKQRIFFILISALLLPVYGFSQQTQYASLYGNISSAKTNEAVFGATVVLHGTSIGAVTDFDGNFLLENLPAGTSTFVITSVSYVSDTLQLNLQSGEHKLLNVKLKDHYLSLETVNVQAKAVHNTRQAILSLKQHSAKVMDGVSGTEIAKRGDGNIASAAKRVTGVTVERGKYVYVRGLSDRYSKTLVNQSEIPGLDPNRNTVQLDLFPTNFIENISISKSFSPDLPGDFSGGAVNIQTKEVPSSYVFGFSSGISFNTQSSFKQGFLSHRKGSLDALALDGGERAKPTSVQSTNIPALFQDNTLLQNITQSFSKEMDVSEQRSGLNHNYAVQIGNEKQLFHKPIRFFLGATYKKLFQHFEKDAVTARYNLTGNAAEVNSLTTNRYLKDTKSAEQFAWGILGNIQYQLQANSTIGAQFFRNQHASIDARFSEGIIPMDARGVVYQTRNLGYMQRSMQFTQLYGNHLLGEKQKWSVNWISSYTLSTQNQPDLRYFNNDYEISNSGDTLYRVQGALYNVPTRFYRELSQESKEVKANITYRFNPESKQASLLKFGFSGVQKQRKVSQNRYNYQLQGLSYTGDVQDFFSNQNMQLPGVGSTNSNGYMYIADATEKRNQYKGEANVYAAYIMLDYWLSPKLRYTLGARLEKANVQLITADPSIEKGYLQNTDVLPSLNVTFKVKESQNLRFSYGRTLARPTFREIAPFADYDFATGWVRVGNPQLERGLNDNIDIRWEAFPGFGELYSIGGFFKRFHKPIEVVFNPLAANATPEISWVNTGNIDQVQSPNAYLYGLEFEAKKKIFSSTFVGANLALIRSITQIDSLSYAVIQSGNGHAKNTRPMYGQSPYVVNAFIEQSFDSVGLSACLVYNVSGPRLSVVMLGGIPDVYQQAFHQLDFTLKKQINKVISIRFSAKNLLDPLVLFSHEYKGESYPFTSFRRGRSFGLSVNVSLR